MCSWVNMTQKEYGEYVKGMNPPSPMGKNILKAFLVGGAICCIGQAIGDGYQALGLTQEDASTAVSMTLVFLSTFFTALGLYHKLARHAGAGTLVPITGFANSVVSPAMDTKSEGFILGVGAKIFIISGPVILYGIFSGALYGVIYWLTLVL